MLFRLALRINFVKTETLPQIASYRHKNTNRTQFHCGLLCLFAFVFKFCFLALFLSLSFSLGFLLFIPTTCPSPKLREVLRYTYKTLRAKASFRGHGVWHLRSHSRREHVRSWLVYPPDHAEMRPLLAGNTHCNSFNFLRAGLFFIYVRVLSI